MQIIYIIFKKVTDLNLNYDLTFLEKAFVSSKFLLKRLSNFDLSTDVDLLLF